MPHLNASQLPMASFTVVPSITGGRMKFTVTDTGNLLTSTKMIRAVLNDAIQQWMSTNAAQIVTNGASAALGRGKYDYPGPGDGFINWRYNFGSKYAMSPAVTTTSFTTANITVTVPYADCA